METVHVIALNPYRKGNKGKVFSYNIDTYDKVIGSKEIKKMIQQIRGELPIDGGGFERCAGGEEGAGEAEERAAFLLSALRHVQE